MSAPAGRPWLSPGRPPPSWPMFDDQPRPRWWHGIGRRVALVALLVILDPARAARALADPIRDFHKDGDT